MSPARRLDGILPSPIRKVSDFAAPDAIPLGLGAPTWELPAPARAALAELSGTCPYGPNAGRTELREAIAGYHGIKTDQVLVTVGSQDALFSLFLAWLDPGDEVLVPEPCFPAYPTLAQLAGARTVGFPLREEARWTLEPDAFAAALERHPKVKLAIINHPSNPTGGGTDKAALRKVAELCASRDVLLISDEVYRDLYFGSRPPSLLEVADTGVVVSSVSKGWGAPGLRVGWIAGSPKWIAPATTIHSYAVTSAAWTSQVAALALIRNSHAVLEAARQEVRVRWDALAAACRKELGIEAVRPAGSFYYWVRLPADAADDALAFCLRLRDEAKVVIIPGTAFGDGGRGYARISFAATPAQISEGIRRLAPWFRR